MYSDLQQSLRDIIDVELRIAFYRQQTGTDTINLSTAENVLLFDFYQQNLFDWSNRPPITENNLRYPSKIFGDPSYQQSWAALLNTAWGTPTLLQPDDIYAVGGVSAALECLAFALSKPGDTVISPAPLWYGFPWSFQQRPGLTFVPFHLTAAGIENFTLTLADVQRAYQETSPPPRFLILTNPNNPLGGNYPKATLEAIYQWVLAETEMHIISDEIYFLSQAEGGEPFVTAFNIDAVKNAGEVGKNRVHTVWGLAKDFGMSGFKVGFVMSRNPTVRAMMKGSEVYKSMAWFTPFDSLKQFTLGPLFLDAAGNPQPELAQRAMALYAGGAGSLLDAQYQATRRALDDGGLDYYKQNHAGIFFWLDLRKFLDRVPAPVTNILDGVGYKSLLHPTIDPREERLSNYIHDEANVSLIPGQECYSLEPGYFRLCYTAEPKERVVQGIAKMAEVLNRLP